MCHIVDKNINKVLIFFIYVEIRNSKILIYVGACWIKVLTIEIQGGIYDNST